MLIDQANLMKAWQRYIEITGCEKSKIPVKDLEQCQMINFKDSDFTECANSKGIFVSLSSDQINHLKKKFVLFNNETKMQTLGSELTFAFPLLNVYERNDSFYLPIFMYELPKDFLLTDNFTGFDIHSNLPDSFKVNLAVLMNYFDVDTDEIDESRNVIELMSIICDRPFHDFKSMYFGFLEWANARLSEKANFSKRAYFAKHTHGIIYTAKNDDLSTSRDIQDFKHIISEMGNNNKNAIPEKYPLLNEYITKQGGSQSIVDKHSSTFQPTLGLFEKAYPLGRGQYQSIQAANTHPKIPLIAVQGAPGTGKTTLFKSLIAQQITARAIAVIQDNDQNLNMLVCSTAVKAVDNIIADLKEDSFTEDLDWLWFHGGSNLKVKNEIEERVKPHIARLESAEFNETEYNQLLMKIVIEKNSIEKKADEYQSAINELDVLHDKLPFSLKYTDFDEVSINSQLQSFLKDLNPKLDKAYQQDEFDRSTVLKLHGQCILLLNKIEQQIDEMKEALSNVQSLITYWPTKFSVSQFSDWMLNKRVRGKFTVSFTDFFKLNFLKIILKFSPAKLNIIHACEALTHHDDMENLTDKYSSLQDQSTIFALMRKSIDNVNCYIDLKKKFIAKYEDCRDLSDVMRLRCIDENRNIFELSIQFLYLEQVRRKNDVVAALNHWCAMLEGGNTPTPHFGKYLREAEQFYRDISLAYPVVATTITSAYKMSAYKQLKQLNGVKPWNLALVDEAGMVSVENLVPIVARSNNAMIVGDPLQLEPIRTISKPSIQKIYQEFFKNKDEEYAMMGPGQVTTYHRSAGTLTGEINDIGDGIVLDEHRRCQAPIAQLFIDLSKYKGISIATTQPSERIQKCFESFGEHHLMFYHVDGQRFSGKTNLDEVKAIGELLDELEKAGYDLTQDVGIITPYADQRRLLINEFAKRMNHDHLAKIGTIHQFQGVGFEVIIFSPVIFEQKDSASFLNMRPNMLNVAVSRAKQQFIVVGNYHKLISSKGNLGMLAERASADFYIELGQQSKDYEKLNGSFKVERHIHDENHIKAFEHYLKYAKDSVVIVVPWIRKPNRSKHQVQLELIKAAKERGVSIKVYYGYSNIETNQKDDNDQYLVQEYIRILGPENVIRLPQGTHEKVLLIDDRILVVGSWNWLSNAYYKWYSENNSKSSLAIRRETSVIILDRQLISQYKAQNLSELA